MLIKSQSEVRLLPPQPIYQTLLFDLLRVWFELPDLSKSWYSTQNGVSLISGLEYGIEQWNGK